MDTKFSAESHGGYEFELSGITIILGANGAGKSTLLDSIKENYESVYIEGGRTIRLGDNFKIDRGNFERYSDPEKVSQHNKALRKSGLDSRLNDSILTLVKKEQFIKEEHSDAVHKWQEMGSTGAPPIRSQAPLEIVFDQFNEVFPHIELTYDKANGQINVANGSAPLPYAAKLMSDGEKQVFSLLVDLLQLDDDFDFIVADEPELNLHPELAERLWTLIETKFQDKNFTYATHSIQFALRPSVNNLYVLTREASRIRKISNISDMQREELVMFLGGVPGILNANKVVVTEGHEKSFDSIFYRWLISDDSVEIFACGNCNDVRQVVNKQGLWEQISTDIKLIGIVDSDFRSEEGLGRIVSEDLLTLKLHEAESYLCLPELVTAISSSIGSQELQPTEESISKQIVSELIANKYQIALRRTFFDSHHTARLSLERRIQRSITSKEQAIEAIKEKADDEISKAVVAMDGESFENRFTQELDAIEEVIQDNNVILALALLPGKELLSKIAPLTGCRNGTDMMRSVKRNLNPCDFQLISELSQAILNSIDGRSAEIDDGEVCDMSNNNQE